METVEWSVQQKQMEMLLKMKLFANRHYNYSTAQKCSFVSQHITFSATCLLLIYCICYQDLVSCNSVLAIAIGNLFISPFLSSAYHHILFVKRGPRKEQKMLVYSCQRLSFLSVFQEWELQEAHRIFSILNTTNEKQCIT